MSFFSDKFREVLAAGAVPVAVVAETAGISTSLLYKIQSGTRLPDSLEMLERLLEIIHCGLPQKKSLVREYLICRIGKHRYESFQELKAMLSEFTAPVPGTTEISYHRDSLPSTNILGEDNVNAAVQQLLSLETARPGGRVLIFSDLGYSPGISALYQALSRCSPEFGSVTHLFTLRATGSDDAVLENMKAFRVVLPQMARLSHYDPRYCYLPDPNDGTVPYPYFIVTSEGVLLLAGDCRSALFLREPIVQERFSLEFRRIMENFRPCMEAGFGGLEAYFYGFDRILGSHVPTEAKPVIIGALPCVLPCVSPEFAMGQMPEEMKKDPALVEIAEKYFRGAALGGYETFFSMDGLEHLVSTGEIMELQGDCVPRLPREVTLDALEELLRRAKSGLVVLRIFRNSFIPVTTRFSATLRGRELMLYCESSAREVVFTTLAENTLAVVVSEYVKHAELLGDVFSPEESIAHLEAALRRYRH